MSDTSNAFPAALAFSLLLTTGAAAAPTIFPSGMTVHEEGVAEGYVLFPGSDEVVYLIDVEGNQVHSWDPQANLRGPSRPLPGGHVLTAAGTQLREYDWDGNIVWSLNPPAGVNGFHHDWERLPNGNTLVTCRRVISAPAISNLQIQEHFVMEFSPAGSVVWEWYPSDHFEEFGFPEERKDQMFARGGNLFHANTSSVIPENTSHTDPRFSPGNVIMSYRNQNTIFVVDRTTGEIAWVMTDQTLGQHTTHMLPDDVPGSGNILVFDNGMATTWSVLPHRPFSRVVEIDPLTDTFPFVYTAEDSGLPKDTFFNPKMSSAQRLSNGNTLIAEADWGRIFEITAGGDLVWEYISPYTDPGGDNGPVYRAYKVPLEWAGPHFSPDLVVSGSAAPDPVQVGNDVTYTIQVENVGADPAVSVGLTQATPVGTSFQSVSAPAGWSCSTPAVGGSGTITCNVSELSAGAGAILSVVLEVDLCGVDGTTFALTSSAASLGSDDNPGDNATTIDASASSDGLIQNLVARLTNARQDVQLDWEDAAPSCGYHVLRATPAVAFQNSSGSLPGNSYTDPGAGASSEDYFYLIEID